MSGLVTLCADAVSLQHPEALGLAGESLTAQEWLRVFSSAEEARRFLRSDRLVDEVWVASSEDVDAINLAATLKRDRGDRCVCLLAFEGTGSLWSRANAAGIDASLTRQAFVARYGQRKRLAASAVEARARREEARRADEGLRKRAVASLGLEQQDAVAAQSAGAAGVQMPAAAPRGSAGRSAQAAGMAPAAAGAQTAAAAGAVPAAVQAAPPTRSAFLLPIVGGGGGVGKSTVSVLCALLAQRRGLKTLLLDFDLQFGDTPHLLGIEGALGADEALASPGKLDALKPTGDLPALLAAPARLELSETVASQAPKLIEALSGCFDVIVANTGAAWAEQHAVLLERCSKALFLVDQRPSSIAACQRALDLCARCGIASGPFSFAVNRCSKRSLFSSIDVSCALHVQQVFELADGGRDVEELLGAGMPRELLESRNALCESVEGLLDELLPQADGERAQGRRPQRAGLFGGRRRGRRAGGAQ